MIPIFINHCPDLGSIIGKAEVKDGGLLVTMAHGRELTEEEIFSMFGCIGYEVIEMIEHGDLLRFKSFLILQWSLNSR